MKVIIAGSRSIRDVEEVRKAIDASGMKAQITQIVSGNALGVDRLGERWAAGSGIFVKMFQVSADEWRQRGKRAGIERNARMAEYADALIAVWDGLSSGTKNMVWQMRRRGKPVFVRRVPCR